MFIYVYVFFFSCIISVCTEKIIREIIKRIIFSFFSEKIKFQEFLTSSNFIKKKQCKIYFSHYSFLHIWIKIIHTHIKEKKTHKIYIHINIYIFYYTYM